MYIMYAPEYGKIEAQVKSAASSRSKLAGGLEPVSLVETMIIAGKNRDTVGGVQLLHRYNITDWQICAQAGLVREIIIRLIKPGVKEPVLYRKLKAYFQALEQENHPNVKAFFTLRFIWQVLKILGHVDYSAGKIRSSAQFTDLIKKNYLGLEKILNYCMIDSAETREIFSKEELSGLKKLTLISLRYFLECDLRSTPVLS